MKEKGKIKGNEKGKGNGGRKEMEGKGERKLGRGKRGKYIHGIIMQYCKYLKKLCLYCSRI